MKKEIAAVIMSALIFGCAKHELVSVDGQDTNRWQIVKDWNGQKGWIGASYQDGESAAIYEALNDDRAFTFVTFNSPRCEDELSVDRQRYIAKSTKQQRSGYTECHIQVFGVNALNIANKMAAADTINFNGHEMDVRGFDSIMKNYFLSHETQSDALGLQLKDMHNSVIQHESQSLPVSKYGNWITSQSGDMFTAGLKSISSTNASIMIVGNKNKVVFAFLETDQPDYAECKTGLSIDNEDFDPKINSMNQDGKLSCSYVIDGQEAQYILSLIESKKTIYVDGVVFETSGFDSLKYKLPN